MDFFAGINFYAVAVSTVVYYIIGFLWYTVLFGKLWGKETGVEMNNKAKPNPWILIGQLFSTFLYVLGVAVILKLYGTYGIPGALCVSAIVIVFFVIPMNTGNLFFTGKKKLFLLDVCERTIGTVVTGIILGMWQ